MQISNSVRSQVGPGQHRDRNLNVIQQSTSPKTTSFMFDNHIPEKDEEYQKDLSDYNSTS